MSATYTIRVCEVIEYEIDVTADSASAALFAARNPLTGHGCAISARSDADCHNRTARIIRVPTSKPGDSK